MNIIWKNSPNKDSNRKPIDRVVLHWFGLGTLESANTRFQNPEAQVSAHYGISEDTIYQWVKESDVAYHAGNYAMNQRSIGIEHDATTTKNASDKTYETAGKLLADICKRNSIPLDREHILKHSEVSATQCPGTLDIDRIISLAKGEELSLTQDITTEIEEKFNLKDFVRYNKYWTYEELIQDWVALNQELSEASNLADKWHTNYIDLETIYLESNKKHDELTTSLYNDITFKSQTIENLNKIIEERKVPISHYSWGDIFNGVIDKLTGKEVI